MLTLVEMDPRVTVTQQMEETDGHVILINKFDVGAEDVDRFLEAWANDAAVMKRQPGFISTQLHRGIQGSGVFLNCAVWESSAHFKRAFMNPEFRSHMQKYPSGVVVSPHLFRKVAVPGICVD